MAEQPLPSKLEAPRRVEGRCTVAPIRLFMLILRPDFKRREEDEAHNDEEPTEYPTLPIPVCDPPKLNPHRVTATDLVKKGVMRRKFCENISNPDDGEFDLRRAETSISNDITFDKEDLDVVTAK